MVAKINVDYELRQTRKIYAKLAKTRKPWLSSFKYPEIDLPITCFNDLFASLCVTAV